MAIIVKTYQPQIQIERTPDVRRGEYRNIQLETPPGPVAPGPEASGAGFGRTVASIGQQLLEQERLNADNARLVSADREAGELENQLMYHPEKGALNIRGEAAFGLPDQVTEAWRNGAAKIRERLGNDRQRIAFDDHSNARLERMIARLGPHIAEEGFRVHSESVQGKAENEIEAAIADGQPERIARSIESIKLAYSDYGAMYELSPEITKSSIAKAVSRIHVGVINNKLSRGDGIAAKVYYDEFQRQILGSEHAELQRKLDVSSTAGDAFRTANDIWNKLGPKSDTDTINIDALSNAARSRFGDDAKRANATIDELKLRASEFDAGVKMRREAAGSRVWQMALTGMPLAQIKNSPEYLSLDGRTQATVDEHTVDRLYELNERAKSAAEYLRMQTKRAQDEAWEAESRTRTRQAWAKQDKDEAAYAAYEDILSDVSNFAKMTDDQIVGKLPVIGRTLTNDLLTKRKELNSPDKVLNATLENELFNEVADDLGLNPYVPNKTEKQRGRLGALRNYTLGVIAVEQAKTKQFLDRDRKREIMETAAREIVVQQGSWWNFFPGGAPFSDVVKRGFDLTIEDIPARDRQLIEAALRSTNQRVTNEAIIREYVDTQARLKKR